MSKNESTQQNHCKVTRKVAKERLRTAATLRLFLRKTYYVNEQFFSCELPPHASALPQLQHYNIQLLHFQHCRSQPATTAFAIALVAGGMVKFHLIKRVKSNSSQILLTITLVAVAFFIVLLLINITLQRCCYFCFL